MNIGPIRSLGYLNPPWTPHYGYAQVKHIENRVRIIGLMSHDAIGDLVGPAPVNAQGQPTDYSNMAVQLRTAYANASSLLAILGARMEDVIEETLYVVNLGAVAGLAAGVRQDAYGRPWPTCKSRLIRTRQLLFPEQLVEIALTVKVASWDSHLNPDAEAKTSRKAKVVGAVQHCAGPERRF